MDSRYVGTAMKTIVKKLLLDQFVLTPPLLCAFFISKLVMVPFELYINFFAAMFF